ncbi:nuclear transport factor 2 family protein [Parafrankia sp. FMc6]|uniref:nuclear transport factor 2 family protein n=1 Tax=Parafrankia soli TaxID=2599596 RepID=UPI0034D3E741
MTAPQPGQAGPLTAQQANPLGQLNQVTRLVTTLLSAWNESDPGRRTDVLETCCAPEISYVNPISAAQGPAAVADLIGAINTQFPGIAPHRTSGIDFHHTHARFSWVMRDRAGQELLAGFDIVTLTPDQARIASVVTFFGPLPPATVTYTYEMR